MAFPLWSPSVRGSRLLLGSDEWNFKYIREFSGCEDVPWVIARNRDELENRLKKLIENGGLRNRSGVASRRFMERYWTEQHVLKILMETYKTL